MLGEGARPFPLKTNNCLPSRAKSTPVGYHPVGMKPLTELLVLLLMSTTATVLSSALATSSVFPSGARARALGVAVRGASGNSVIEISSIACPVTVLNTQTLALLPQAMNRRLQSAENTIALGC